MPSAQGTVKTRLQIPECDGQKSRIVGRAVLGSTIVIANGKTSTYGEGGNARTGQRGWEKRLQYAKDAA